MTTDAPLMGVEEFADMVEARYPMSCDSEDSPMVAAYRRAISEVERLRTERYVLADNNKRLVAERVGTERMKPLDEEMRPDHEAAAKWAHDAIDGYRGVSRRIAPDGVNLARAYKALRAEVERVTKERDEAREFRDTILREGAAVRGDAAIREDAPSDWFNRATAEPASVQPPRGAAGKECGAKFATAYGEELSCGYPSNHEGSHFSGCVVDGGPTYRYEWSNIPASVQPPADREPSDFRVVDSPPIARAVVRPDGTAALYPDTPAPADEQEPEVNEELLAAARVDFREMKEKREAADDKEFEKALDALELNAAKIVLGTVAILPPKKPLANHTGAEMQKIAKRCLLIQTDFRIAARTEVIRLYREKGK